MKRGFVTETHVLIYCDRCGECCTDSEGESICFDNLRQALRYLIDTADMAGWQLSGGEIECADCRHTHQPTTAPDLF
ncbi:hypothetical protein IU449_00115 [Nocardia higoensis]|uniref:Uncharacterized protein n=1 Tax=Nocardia higoensis TaxID=228599 RepID=A0ABS0D392_9NOCA|nr:hypothetical protein [Nocardia higoensis]MBF6352965.1 hypothetical protein [Nocardia higoensis]